MEKITSYVTPNTIYTFTIGKEVPLIRIDTFITQKFTAYSRNFFQKLIQDKRITCNGKIVNKPSIPIKTNDVISIHFPPIITTKIPRPFPSEITVDVIHEHPDFLIINKPAGLIVHKPSHNHTGPTLVDWLIQHFKEISNVGAYDRPGIVHRLDQYTSGLMIIPRTNYAHTIIGNMFRDRTINKEYLAVVEGHPEPTGTIDFSISRDPRRRNRMTYKRLNGRSATTHYKVLEYYQNAALVNIKPVTGRTHQIRVHFSAIGHPIVGDTIYGTKSKYIKRQALHAHAVSFVYQDTPFRFSCEISQDIQKLINIYKKFKD